MSAKPDINTTPGSAAQWYDLGVSHMRLARFGDAVNAFQNAADAASEEEAAGVLASGEAAVLRSRASASIELIQEINGFVNTDLMNP